MKLTMKNKHFMKCIMVATALYTYSLSAIALPNCTQGSWHNCTASWTYDDGAHYVGDFVDGKRTGKGTYIYKNGKIEEGFFENKIFMGAENLIEEDIKEDYESALNALSDEELKTDRAPDLSREDILNFSDKISSCWSVSENSSFSSISVELFMKNNGQIDEIKLLSQKQNNDEQASIAFAIARRAILECQGGGYSLPKSLYAQWKHIVIDFSPENLRRE